MYRILDKQKGSVEMKAGKEGSQYSHVAGSTEFYTECSEKSN